MLRGVVAAVLPDNQRRTLDELTDDLDLNAGDRRSKKSAFWTMLVLSAIIASAGVLSDSTATVIGAMIIAPLSIPILGVGLGLAKRQGALTWRSLGYVGLGAVTVIAIGVVFSFFLPSTFNLLGNSQIAGRTSPGLFDLIAALATGIAGAVAMARRDVAAVLPGVAIAISLVPPLAVVGVCLGQRAPGLALGALLLFVSNLLALVLVGTFVFAILGYGSGGPELEGRPRRKAYIALFTLLLLIFVPLLGNTLGTLLVSVWSDRVEAATNIWLDPVPAASVEDISFASDTVYVQVLSPVQLPPVAGLLAELEGEIPNGIEVVVLSNVGEEVRAGRIGAQ